MHLSKHDLFQMNDGWLKKLPAELLLEVSKRLLHDVQELRDRLSQNPDNGSRPPTSQPPWAKTGGSEEQSGAADERGTADVAAGAAESSTEQAPLESGALLWLWALVTTHTVLFLIGPRRREMLENALQDGFAGLLISDGYGVHGAWANRLRCWPHLLRKLGGLAESSDARVSGVGQEMEGIMKALMAVMHAARIDPLPEGLPARCANAMARLRYLCEAHRMDEHSVLRSVVREFLYEGNVILRPVAEPHLPLSNNAAEQVLRHWVISPTISHGTRSEEGSRAFAFLASLIETCRRRGASAWQYLGTVIAAARNGLQLPMIAAIPATVSGSE